MVVTRMIQLQSKGEGDVLDVTDQVQREVAACELQAGTVTLFVPGSTAGITTVEYEPGLVADMGAMWQRLAPREAPYQHDRRWGDGNGYAHVRAALLGASLVVPFRGRELMLGTWQQIVLVDFDNRPRQRRLVLQIVGE
jgi:secondary thiamine-phosphate synthase enzyme